MVTKFSSKPIPVLAALLSFLIPGLGQLYNRERAKGIAVLCIALGMWAGLAMTYRGPAQTRSWISVILLGMLYLFIWIPAVLDAYQRAAGQPQPILSGGRRWYVIFMLLTVGPMALPLLWQSPRFSRTAKIIWTVLIIVVALVTIAFVVVVGPALEQVLQQLQADGSAFP